MKYVLINYEGQRVVVVEGWDEAWKILRDSPTLPWEVYIESDNALLKKDVSQAKAQALTDNETMPEEPQ